MADEGMEFVIHVHDVLAEERAKYDEVWSLPGYHAFSPGMENVKRFMTVLKPAKGSTVVDIGCGSGAAGLAFEARGMRASWVDLTDAALDAAVDRRRFTECAIWDARWTTRRPLGWDYGFCCDVLEHVPTEFTMLAVERIIRACRTSWLQIALEPDSFGQMIGQPLHLTVQPFEWWRDRIAALGRLVEARDLCGVGLFVVA